MTEVLANRAALLRYWQEDQRKHDKEFHDDIYNLSVHDRLKHMALHFCKYVGRFAAEGTAQTERSRKTVVDVALIGLTAGYLLHLNYQMEVGNKVEPLSEDEVLNRLAVPAGRFADAIEKMDHVERGGPQQEVQVLQILLWVIAAADLYGVNLDDSIRARRQEIRDSNRNFDLNKRAIC